MAILPFNPMAKIILTIEDQGSGLVRVVTEPSFKTMTEIMTKGHGLTPAHRIAMFALRSMQKASVDPSIKNNINKIIIP